MVRPLAATVALLAGAIGLWTSLSVDQSDAHESAPPVTLAESLPAGAVVATVTGVDDEPLSVKPGAVLELTFAGPAAAGHAPCSTLGVLVDGRWTTTHFLGSAFGAEQNLFGGPTYDIPVDDRDGRLFTTSGDSATQIVCPAMDMVSAGPERFRLPLTAPAGPARLCLNFTEICFALDYRS